ncbi:hypothetical protein B0T22DRAFT_439454 [Podospora appendiculata]|uniref:Uncharacterized protein n=1 Tax=Podospora appendiculata TaxID=314037 RepID=A0AAE1CBV0_9PEZI|nr:hypothetical protein B0T22DRAFT_439454 [Podospora appendiculata]
MGWFDEAARSFDCWADSVARDLMNDLVEKLQQAAKLKEDLEREADDFARQAAQTLEEGIELAERLPQKMWEERATEKSSIINLASAAADEGTDITEAVKAAVEIAFKKVTDAMDMVIEKVKACIEYARRELFELLMSILPDEARPLLEMLEENITSMVNNLVNTGNELIHNAITTVLDGIKQFTLGLIEKVGEVLGPVWKFATRLWKLLFGEPPEQCMITMQWFQERMERTEWQLLSAAPITAVIRKQRFFDLLPPQEDAWRQQTLDFLSRASNTPVWRTCRIQMERELSRSTNPMPGCLVNLIWDQDCVDELGGRQRLHISVLYFLWKTDEFRAVSAGFLGILAMLSAIVYMARCTIRHVYFKSQNEVLRFRWTRRPLQVYTMNYNRS